MRLYLTIHSDHEGGNVSAHATHLVGSALSDPYLSFCAGMCGLAGPLHGLANQEVLIFMEKFVKAVGLDATDDQMKDFVWSLLKSGQVVPGYGHAVLRKTRVKESSLLSIFPTTSCSNWFLSFTCWCHLFSLRLERSKTHGQCRCSLWCSPPVLWNERDELLHSLFGVSRALGVTASLVWDRALGLPLERPKSMSTPGLKKLVGAYLIHFLPACVVVRGCHVVVVI